MVGFRSRWRRGRDRERRFSEVNFSKVVDRYCSKQTKTGYLGAGGSVRDTAPSREKLPLQHYRHGRPCHRGGLYLFLASTRSIPKSAAPAVAAKGDHKALWQTQANRPHPTRAFLTLPTGATVRDVLAFWQISEEEVFLMLRNGQDINPGLVDAPARLDVLLDHGDVIAFSGPVPYSFGYGAPVV